MTEVICIVCPKGCRLKVDEAAGFSVAGQGCPRGEAYGKGEVQNPTRVVTSTVRVEQGSHRRCPVKTAGAIPKGLVLRAMALLDGVTLSAPVQTGQVVVPDICGTGVAFVATRDIELR